MALNFTSKWSRAFCYSLRSVGRPSLMDHILYKGGRSNRPSNFEFHLFFIKSRHVHLYHFKRNLHGNWMPVLKYLHTVKANRCIGHSGIWSIWCLSQSFGSGILLHFKCDHSSVLFELICMSLLTTRKIRHVADKNNTILNCTLPCSLQGQQLK